MSDPCGTFYEFFAGGGMARLGLGGDWRCLFANDMDPKKCKSYRQNWGDGELREADVKDLEPHDLPGHGDLVWASFPCQDLSLAGNGAGLRGERSGSFWPFWRLIQELKEVGRAPRMVVLENVCGALSSHNGRDFAAIRDALRNGGYRLGALVMDAKLFIPQSRPRLFVVGLRDDLTIPAHLESDGPIEPWHTTNLVKAFERSGGPRQKDWIWWNIRPPQQRKTQLTDLIEGEPTGVDWHTSEQTDKLLDMMSDAHRAKVEEMLKAGMRAVGTIYKRMRRTKNGDSVQRAEIRFDGIAGCLRTPAGGSSRQLLLVIQAGKVRSRLLSSREGARLMGLPETYLPPTKYNEAYHLLGDGLVIPVVRYLAAEILEPILNANPRVSEDAA